MVDLDLEAGPTCHYDYVELYDGTQVGQGDAAMATVTCAGGGRAATGPLVRWGWRASAGRVWGQLCPGQVPQRLQPRRQGVQAGVQRHLRHGAHRPGWYCDLLCWVQSILNLVQCNVKVAL